MESTYRCSHQIQKILNPSKKERAQEPEPRPPAGKRNFYQREKPKYRKKPLTAMFEKSRKKRKKKK